MSDRAYTMFVRATSGVGAARVRWTWKAAFIFVSLLVRRPEHWRRTHPALLGIGMQRSRQLGCRVPVVGVYRKYSSFDPMPRSICFFDFVVRCYVTAT